MTDLTEQWEKGELPDGWYYTEIDLYENRDYIEIIPNTYNDCFEYGIVKQVLAPIPSFEEWQASEKYNKHLEEVIKIYERKDKQATETSIAYNELLEENAQLKERNDSLNNRDINLCRIANGIRDENFALKELLKECRKSFNKLKGDTVWYPYEVDECIAKIDEALK